MNFKYVMAALLDDEYMIDDEVGTVVRAEDLIIEDDEDEAVARYCGWTDLMIDQARV